MGDIRSCWVDITPADGPILLRLGHATKWQCSGTIFEISLVHRKSRSYPSLFVARVNFESRVKFES